MPKPLITLLLWMAPLLAAAQIRLVNGGFEGDEPQDATVPAGWHICTENSTPDILPGVWGVYTEPSEGETFVGMITRSDGTWESIGQRTPVALLARECYSITLDLAFSKTYAGYNNPIRVRIWGGATKCKRDQLLAESPLVDHTDWKTYSFSFVPKEEINYIFIEAFHLEGKFSHKGNILIDHIRPIKQCIRADAGRAGYF